MRSSFAVLLLLGALAAGCGGSTTPTGPSPTPITNPLSVSIALTGSVTDAQDNAALADVMVQVVSGPDIEKFTTTDAAGNYSLQGLKVGAFVVRFSRSGFETLERTVSASQDSRVDAQLRRGPACLQLAAPAGFRVDVVGSTVTFNWSGVAGADDYIIGVGTTAGTSRSLTTNTTQTTYVWRGAPSRTYYARVVARSACGRSNSSNEITFTVVGT